MLVLSVQKLRKCLYEGVQVFVDEIPYMCLHVIPVFILYPIELFHYMYAVLIYPAVRQYATVMLEHHFLLHA